MGTYNILRTSLQCPHCNTLCEVEIEILFGDTREMSVYTPGQMYRWVPQKAVQNGGRPEHGDLDGEGYCECPLCQRDFFVIVQVRGDVLEEVQVNNKKPGYLLTPRKNASD